MSGWRRRLAAVVALVVLALPAAAGAGGSAALPSGLTLHQLAGQRIIYDYEGLTPPQSLIDRIREGEAAGVIFFAGNISSHAQITAVIARLQRANESSPVHAPLLMMTDQEGGEVKRLAGQPELSEQAIGASSSAASLASAAGAGAGSNLRGVGMNVNLAPVVDVRRVAGNFIDEYGRSYGGDPRLDGVLAGDFITAQQKAGVAATAKHFPGLGAAAAGQNTDEQPVTLTQSLTQLRTVDEVPFQAAIAAGAELVMTSWAVYPALDSRLPAGLSSKVIAGELRGHLGFTGVTVTDSLGAGALSAYGTVAERGLLAARAGADLLLCKAADGQPDGPDVGLSVLDALAHAMSVGTLSRADSLTAARRVFALRASFASS